MLHPRTSRYCFGRASGGFWKGKEGFGLSKAGGSGDEQGIDEVGSLFGGVSVSCMYAGSTRLL